MRAVQCRLKVNMALASQNAAAALSGRGCTAAAGCGGLWRMQGGAAATHAAEDPYPLLDARRIEVEVVLDAETLARTCAQSATVQQQQRLRRLAAEQAASAAAREPQRLEVACLAALQVWRHATSNFKFQTSNFKPSLNLPVELTSRSTWDPPALLRCR